MPGIRKKNKRSFGFYWHKSEIELLKSGADAMELDMSTYVKLLVHAQAEAAEFGTPFPEFAKNLRSEAEKRHMPFNEYVKGLYEVDDDEDKRKPKGAAR